MSLWYTILRPTLASQDKIISHNLNTPTPITHAPAPHTHTHPRVPCEAEAVSRWLHTGCRTFAIVSAPGPTPTGGRRQGGFLVLREECTPTPSPIWPTSWPICFPLPSTRQGAAAARPQGCEVYVAGFGAGGDRATHTHADIHWTSPTLLYVNTSIYPHMP